jgi:cytochrome c-type biogenesis protein CcmH
MRRLLALSLGFLALAGVAHAAAPEASLSDPAQEARAQALAREIRCVVCENEPVALSSAEIAVDMRAAIRERVKAGDSDAQVRRFFAERYGEFVLLRPRMGLDTLALWSAPFLLLLIGAAGLFFYLKRGQNSPAEPDPIDDDAARAALAEVQQDRP